MCVCVGGCVRLCVCARVFVCEFVCEFVCMCMCVWVCVHVGVCLCVTTGETVLEMEVRARYKIRKSHLAAKFTVEKNCIADF